MVLKILFSNLFWGMIMNGNDFEREESKNII